MEDIRRKYNPIMDLSKFTSNNNIKKQKRLSGVVALVYNQVCYQTLSLYFGSLNNILCPYKQKEKVQEKFYLIKILKEMYLAILIMRLSYNDFKIRKFVEGNCKTLCVCICVFFLFLSSIYEVFFFI